MESQTAVVIIFKTTGLVESHLINVPARVSFTRHECYCVYPSDSCLNGIAY